MTNQQGAPEALRPIARYKIGYATDGWGMRSSTPSGIPHHAGAWVRYEDHVAALVEAQQPAPSAAAVTEVENLRKALQFYADKDHFNIADDGAWDTVSGEPQNYWCDEEGTATVEDGTIARLALAGHQIKFDADEAPQPSPTPQADSAPADPDGEAFRTAARLGLTLRFYGGCAQSSMPGTPSAYEVVTGQDRAAAMREAVERAAAVIASGGETQRLGSSAPQAASQPAPVPRWDEMIRRQFPDMLPKEWSDTLIRRYMTRELDAYRAARATADSVLEDAARYRWLRHCDLDDMAAKYWPDGEVPTGVEFDAAVDAARKQEGA